MKRFIVLILVLMFGASSVAFALHSGDTLKSATEYDYPPYSVIGEDGEAGGFSVDLLKAAIEAVDLKIEFKVGPWNEIKQELADGKLDILPLVGRTPERKELFDFTFPYFTMHGAIFVRADEKRIRNINDLKHLGILVLKADNAEEYAIRNNISDNLISVDSYNEAFTLLSEGNYDAIIAQEVVGYQIIKKLNINNLKVVDPPLIDFEQNFSFAVTEGNDELLDILNEGLSIVMSDGTYEELHAKWFRDILPPRDITFKDVIGSVGIYVAPMIILIFIISILYMRYVIKRKTRDLRVAKEQAEKSTEKAEQALKNAKASEKETEKLVDAMTGRELKMAELKKQIKKDEGDKS